MATAKTTTKTEKVAKPRSAKATQGEKLPEGKKLLELAVFNMEGKEVSKMTLPEAVFAAPWRADLVHQVTTALQANKRQNRAHTKDRSEVSGGGKKPWKQKGTGQARHGSSRSPIWRHGGITFGPRNTRDYSEKINRKMKARALASVLSKKAKEGEIILVDQFTFSAPKTKAAQSALSAINKTLVTKKKNAALIAFANYDKNKVKSFSNIANIVTEEVRNISPVDILSVKYLVIENPTEAFATLSARTK